MAALLPLTHRALDRGLGLARGEPEPVGLQVHPVRPHVEALAEAGQRIASVQLAREVGPETKLVAHARSNLSTWRTHV